jgi:hypothetical protein
MSLKITNFLRTIYGEAPFTFPFRFTAAEFKLNPIREPVFSKALLTLDLRLILVPLIGGLVLPSLSVTASSDPLSWPLRATDEVEVEDEGDLEFIEEGFDLLEEDLAEDEEEELERARRRERDGRRSDNLFFSFSSFFLFSSVNFICSCC